MAGACEIFVIDAQERNPEKLAGIEIAAELFEAKWASRLRRGWYPS